MTACEKTDLNASLLTNQELQSASWSRGFMDWAFFQSFDGLIFNHVWEDVAVDHEALALEPGHRIVMIGSAGCNALAYLTKGSVRVDAVDMNLAHRAVFELKRTALEKLPDHDAFFRFFGEANSAANIDCYDALLAKHLADETRAFWERRRIGLGRRINMFARGYYRYGLLSRFVGLIHAIAKLRGSDLTELTSCEDLESQREFFDRHIKPMFDAKLTRLIARSPVSLFALGIPPAQHARMVGAGEITAQLRQKIETLACAFPISENPFAWQVFARKYGPKDGPATPIYLTSEAWKKMRSSGGSVSIHATDLIAYLREQNDGSVHRFNLLDAQDWMSTDVIATLWSEIQRTAHPRDARVLFRTAGVADAFRDLPREIKSTWQTDEHMGSRLSKMERSGLYSGVHLAMRKGS